VFQTADKGTEHEKDIKFALIKKRIREVNPRILFDFFYFSVQNEPRLTVLSTVFASVRLVCTLSQHSASLMTRFVIKLKHPYGCFFLKLQLHLIPKRASMLGYGNTLIYKTKLCVIGKQFLLTGQHQPLFTSGLGILDSGF